MLRDELRIGVVTNDIYTTEDADTLKRRGVLDAARIVAVETGCCPHTAIREDITANLDAIEDLEEREGPLDLVLLESGGDNLTLTFSKGLVDVQLFVLDVAGGDKVPRKGGPGVTRSDLLVINKVDIAHLVNADLGVMERDAANAARRTANGVRVAEVVGRRRADRLVDPSADGRGVDLARERVDRHGGIDSPASRRGRDGARRRHAVHGAAVVPLGWRHALARRLRRVARG